MAHNIAEKDKTKRMRKVALVLVAFACAILTAMPQVCAATAKTQEILCVISAVLDDTGVEQTVKVAGVRYSEYSQYFTDIKILISDGREIIPSTDEGYGAGIAAFDFKGEGYDQLFYFASSGGSGGYGYFYVFDCAKEKPEVMFDFRKFKNVYTAEYTDDNRLNVYSGGELFLTYAVSGCENKESSRYREKTNYSDVKPYVTDLNFVESVFVYALNRYRLNVWQNVIGRAQTDVVGRIITTLSWDAETGCFDTFLTASASSSENRRCF